MIIGRSDSGAIKIKTDGGSKRAVECACCVQACSSVIVLYVDGTPVTATKPESDVYHQGLSCTGDNFTFIDDVNCDGSLIYIYETETCRGIGLTCRFLCSPYGIRDLKVDKTVLNTSISSFDCNVCASGDLPQGPCREDTEHQNYDDYFQFNTDYSVGVTTYFYPMSACGCGAPDPISTTMTLRFELP